MEEGTFTLFLSQLQTSDSWMAGALIYYHIQVSGWAITSCPPRTNWSGVDAWYCLGTMTYCVLLYTNKLMRVSSVYWCVVNKQVIVQKGHFVLTPFREKIKHWQRTDWLCGCLWTVDPFRIITADSQFYVECKQVALRITTHILSLFCDCHLVCWSYFWSGS